MTALERARQLLAAADLLAEAGMPESAVSRAYYAAFTAVRAVLEREGATPKTHAGVHRLFADRFVRTGRVSRDDGATFRTAWRERELVDYAGDGPEMGREAAARLVAAMHRLVGRLAPLLDPPPDA